MNDKLTLTEELMRAALSAPDERKAAALRVLRGDAPAVDAETLRRCSILCQGSGGQAGQAERFLTLKECARRLGVSACSLWRWGVPGHELGGRRKFRMSEVEAYLESEEFRQRAQELREEDRERRGKSLAETQRREEEGPKEKRA